MKVLIPLSTLEIKEWNDKIHPHISSIFTQFSQVLNTNFLFICLSLSSIYCNSLTHQFESNEAKNGTGTLAANGKPESIEQDGPSEIFRDDDDSKVG